MNSPTPVPSKDRSYAKYWTLLEAGMDFEDAWRGAFATPTELSAIHANILINQYERSLFRLRCNGLGFLADRREDVRAGLREVENE